MMEQLGLSRVQSGDLAAANMIGYLSLALASGMLASRYGPRVVVGVSMLVIAFAMLLTGVAGGYPAVLAARALAGIGSGGANVPVMALVAAWFVPRRRGVATGLMSGGTSLAIIVTGALAPILVERTGQAAWRLYWVFLAGMTFVVALLGILFLRNRPGELGLAQVGAQEPATKAAQPARSSPPRWALVYRRWPVWQLALIYVAFGFSYIIYATFFATYLTAEAGFSVAQAGALWSGVGAASILSGFLWGGVSDRIGRKYGLALVFLVQSVSYSIFALTASSAALYASALLFALTAWGMPTIVAATAGDIVGVRLAPAAFGFVTLFFGLGQAGGPLAAGRIAEAANSFGPAFLTAGAVALIGSLSSLTIRTRQATDR
jgi:nitrate/nitrite transporter NarK